MLDQGQQCDHQALNFTALFNAPASNHGTTVVETRDCFCDSSCITEGDCCDDHAVLCAHFYPTTTSTTTTTTTTSTTTTTTSTASTTQATTSADTQLFTLLESLKLVFEQNRASGHPELERKWKNITQKWYKQNKKMTKLKNANSSLCIFDGRSFDMTISDTDDACQVSFNNKPSHLTNLFLSFSSSYLFQAINEATNAFQAWGEYYTMDCNKVRRNADDKWFIRNQIKLQKLKERSMLKLKC